MDNFTIKRYIYLSAQLKLVSENKRLSPTKQGRFKNSDVYKNYKEELSYVFKPQIPPDWKTIDGIFGVAINFSISNRKDAQNLLKPILDVVQSLGIVKNDKHLRRLVMTKKVIPPREREMFIMVIEEY